MNAGLLATAEALAHWLEREQTKIVLAESCTGGRIAATLTQIPGVSAVFCGSCVVYRESAKTAWLGVGFCLLCIPKILPELPSVFSEAGAARAGEDA